MVFFSYPHCFLFICVIINSGNHLLRRNKPRGGVSMIKKEILLCDETREPIGSKEFIVGMRPGSPHKFFFNSGIIAKIPHDVRKMSPRRHNEGGVNFYKATLVDGAKNITDALKVSDEIEFALAPSDVHTYLNKFAVRCRRY